MRGLIWALIWRCRRDCMSVARRGLGNRGLRDRRKWERESIGNSIDGYLYGGCGKCEGGVWCLRLWCFIICSFIDDVLKCTTGSGILFPPFPAGGSQFKVWVRVWVIFVGRRR